MPEEVILSVDVGADSIKIAEFKYPDAGGIILENFAFAEYGGAAVEESQMLDSLYASFKTALESQKFHARKVYLCISGQLVFTKFVKLPPVSDPDQIKQIVEYEAKQNLPFPMDEVVWDYQLIRTDDSEDVEAMFVVVKNEIIEKITSIIEHSGRETLLVDVAPTAAYNAARANSIGQEECAMLLNIGGRCSTLIFIDKQRFFVRSIPIAGYFITEQIMKEFNISFKDAEDMKRRFGFVALGGAYEEPDSEVAATVSKIVRNVMTRLHGEINRSINVYRSQQGGRKPEKLYLAGGSSVMAFTPRFFSEKLRMEVEYLNPFQVVSLSDRIDRDQLSDVAHMFSESIGTGLRRATACPIEVSLMPQSLRQKHEMKARMPYLYASAVALLLCMGVTYLGTSMQANFLAGHRDRLDDKIREKEELGNSIASAKSGLESKKSEYIGLTKVLNEHQNWIKILNEVGDLLPDSAWIISLKKGEDAVIAKPQKQVNNPFGGISRTPEKAVSKSNIENISIKFYVLCTPSDPKGEQAWKTFQERVQQSSLFKPNVGMDMTTVASGENNLSYYEVTLSLKNALSL